MRNILIKMDEVLKREQNELRERNLLEAAFAVQSVRLAIAEALLATSVSQQDDSVDAKQAAPYCIICGAYHYPEENTLCEK